ncbi:M48 family metallopeptidase [Dyadobacter sp. CY351]|uniref:tetratricopeptide repeat protein n=1 Tax=Dyadobacter sp. CY351 TaxID=2909337 RepID=UPI001F3803DC|nr:hypothetical protein [Dyadobacter sp. CY351]MCF2518803.1 hypothetical protein [Dyadobacter sp. CY351]
MLELLAVILFFSYIFYLRNYADLRTISEKEEAAFSNGIELFLNNQFDEAYQYFDSKVKTKPKSSIAYLYRGLSQKGKNNRPEAFYDIKTAVSLDDDVYKAHLELAKMYLEEQDVESALPAFSKAISKAQETSPEPYHWRGKAHQEMNMLAEAQADFDSERRILAQISNEKNRSSTVKTPFFDKKLIVSSAMVLFTSALVVAVIKNAESIHFPYFVAVVSAICLGFVEPHKGWLLALLQCFLIVTGYFLLTDPPQNTAVRELENFCLYGSLVLTFVASFLGGFMKRALHMQ